MDGQLKTGTFLTAESSNKYKVISLLGAGGQGEVYDVECGGKHYALKWYFKHMATEEQKSILDMGNPLVTSCRCGRRNSRASWI